MLYKLTDAYDCSRGGTLWGRGAKHMARRQASGRRRVLCSPDLIHAYPDPLLAVMMDPVHSAYLPTGHLWTARGRVAVSVPDKVGCVSLTTIERMEIPTATPLQRVRFVIYAGLTAEAKFRSPHWTKWANRWLSGENRDYVCVGGIAVLAIREAAKTNKSIDLVALAHRAVEDEPA